jgi:hypothetical protein
MSEERDLEIAKEYRSRGGTGRLVEEDGTISREIHLDPPEAVEFWDRVIQPRVDAGDYLPIFKYLR